MIREVDLVDYYLPPFMQTYKEPVATLNAEQPEFQLIWKATERILYNHFISTADECGIERFEKILHIIPETNDTLEIRRSRVQTKWFTALPYTWRMFVKKIIGICGKTYLVTIRRAESYLINLDARIDLQWQIESLIDVVEQMLPCNMGMSIKNVLPLDLDIPTPTIKPNWFGYRVEYKGEIIAGENVLIIKILYIHVLMSFWGSETYNGRRKYDRTMRYNTKRNYGVCVIIKSLFELCMETYIGCLQVFSIFFQHRPEINVSVCNQLGITSDVLLESKLLTYMRLRFLHSDTGMQVITQRNTVRYNGMRRYNGTIKHNALYKKEEVE